MCGRTRPSLYGDLHPLGLELETTIKRAKISRNNLVQSTDMSTKAMFAILLKYSPNWRGILEVVQLHPQSAVQRGRLPNILVIISRKIVGSSKNKLQMSVSKKLIYFGILRKLLCFYFENIPGPLLNQFYAFMLSVHTSCNEFLTKTQCFYDK